MNSLALPVCRLGRFLAQSILAVSLSVSATLVHALPPTPTPTVLYNSSLIQVQGQLPINTSFPVEITPPTFYLGSNPILPGSATLATFRISSTSRPAGVTEAAVADFVKIYADIGLTQQITNVAFGGSGAAFMQTVYVKVAYPGSAVAGPYAFKIFAESPDWPATVKNEGTELNGSVTAPPAPPANPPIVTIATPANGSTVEVPAGSVFPYPVEFRFTASTLPGELNPRPITSVSADLDGTALVIPSVSIVGLSTTAVSVGEAIPSVTPTYKMMVSGVGQHVVTARATNDADLNAVPDVHTFSVVIRKEIVTVTAEAKTKTYGQTNPTLTVTYSGFLPGETLATSGITGAPNITTTATTFSPVLTSGTYPITPSLGSLVSSKYDFVFVDGGLTVTKALLTVQPDAILNKPFGLIIPTLTASITGVIAGEPNTPAYTGSPDLSTNASILSLPGTYLISSAVGTLASNNYAFDFKTAALTIGKGKIIVTAASSTKTYGANNPSFGYSTVGAVAGDTVPFNGAPSITSAATASSSVAGSPYPIVAAVGTMSSLKYDFEFVNGSLAVNRAPLVISAVNKTKVQGAVNPALTYGISGFVLGQTETTAGVFTSPVAISTTALTNSPVGIYPITVSGAVAPNYSISYNNATLTVTESAPPPSQFTACGTVFFDVNRNGCRNTEDTGLGGITVKLYKNNALIASILTAANGTYCFNVDAGHYEVDVIEIPGLTPTNCDERTFTVTNHNVTIPDIGLGFNFCTLQNLNANGKSHGYWKSNLSKAIANKSAQETKANLLAWSSTISSLMLTPFDGNTMQTAVTTMSGSDQLKLQLLASEYNYVSGRLINNSQPLTWAFIYWGEIVAKNPSNYSSSYRNFVKNWMDAYNNSYGGDVDGPTSY